MTVEASKFSMRLRPKDVEEIRQAPIGTKNAELARKYGVTPTTIARVRRGETWPLDRKEVVAIRVKAEVAAELERVGRETGVGPAEVAAGIVSKWASRQSRTKTGDGITSTS